jgi:hypothetical protein
MNIVAYLLVFFEYLRFSFKFGPGVRDLFTDPSLDLSYIHPQVM